MVVALGAFLSHRGATTPLAVFLVAWCFSVAGAGLVYFLARRYGRLAFQGRIGRMLLSPEAVATIERGYLRFGVVGIFVLRLLPGVRSIVAPFAGLVNLGPVRTLAPIALASGLWYGALVAAGAYLGSEWSLIVRFLGRLNRAMGGLLLLLVLLGGVWYLVRGRRRRRARGLALWRTIEEAFGRQVRAADPSSVGDEPIMAAAATLLAELARSDEVLTTEEITIVTGYLRERWGASSEEIRAAGQGATGRRLQDLARRVDRSFLLAEREALLERLWRVALRDGILEGREMRLMERAGLLLGISGPKLDAVRQRVEAQARTHES